VVIHLILKNSSWSRLIMLDLEIQS